MDNSYSEEPPFAHVATASSKVDADWYTDTSAIDHITNDLDRLVVRERYHDNEQVHVDNGSSLKITHIGHSSLNTANHPLVLRNILHVPNITKNLLSVHKFSQDNDIFFEYHPWHFFIKDRQWRKSLQDGRCESGLYPIKSTNFPVLKHALAARSTTYSHWHARLGHPAPQVVQSILHLNELSCSRDSSSSVCNVCQLAKTHRLPYTHSVHCSTSPLEIIHSDV
jgi:hypothetical protein